MTFSLFNKFFNWISRSAIFDYADELLLLVCLGIFFIFLFQTKKIPLIYILSPIFITYSIVVSYFFGFNENFIETIYVEDENYVWFGYREKGLSIYNKEKKEFKHFFPDNDKIKSGRVRTIKKDTKGNYWIGTGGGLYLFDLKNEKFTRYAHDKHPVSKLSQNSIFSSMVIFFTKFPLVNISTISQCAI